MSRDISPGEPLPAELEVYPPPIGRLLFSRGIETAAEAERFFSPDYERDLFSPESLPDMPAAVDRLRTALAAGEKVGIHGDYDADGVCAAALLADALSDLGFAIEVFIPHKEEDGHGLSSRAVEEFAAAGIKLIVTVDCGSSSREEVERARRKGMEVIITDHHLVPPERPRALLVNPKVDPGKYPNPELCGAGVALKLAQALYGRLRPEKSEQTKWLLDLAALATVADMVPLRGENRTLTVYGLLVMSKTRRVGLRALIASALSETDRISAEDVAFSLAPRINAAGRMDHAREAFDLLVEKDASRARERANNLRKLNDRRRSLSEKVIAMAKEQLSALESLPAGVVIG
ncbi:MAG TPA: single-stranded-DNA-specific exonuclease RecJ, partial [Candidatus Moranbacteria bacterium]|nr:single-stranded-DNA-specific exonuclease RecJ [Candidatus Moranbacteria bacterium]